MSISQTPPTTRPYLLRALHEWCCDGGFTPHIVVHVDGSVQVPFEHVKNGEIVLNVSIDSTSALRLGNDFIEFKARFGGVVRDILIPVSHVIAIYARENGQGMAFPAPDVKSVTLALVSEAEDAPEGTASAVDMRSVLRSVSTEFKGVEGGLGDGDGFPPDEPPRGGVRPRPVLTRIK